MDGQTAGQTDRQSDYYRAPASSMAGPLLSMSTTKLGPPKSVTNGQMDRQSGPNK